MTVHIQCVEITHGLDCLKESVSVRVSDGNTIRTLHHHPLASCYHHSLEPSDSNIHTSIRLDGKSSAFASAYHPF